MDHVHQVQIVLKIPARSLWGWGSVVCNNGAQGFEPPSQLRGRTSPPRGISAKAPVFPAQKGHCRRYWDNPRRSTREGGGNRKRLHAIPHLRGSHSAEGRGTAAGDRTRPPASRRCHPHVGSQTSPGTEQRWSQIMGGNLLWIGKFRNIFTRNGE